jgi:hypothetical protein
MDRSINIRGGLLCRDICRLLGSVILIRNITYILVAH